MKTQQTYNPCDDCRHAYSKNGQESGMCKICELAYFKNQAPKDGEWLVADTLREDEDGTWSRYSCSVCGYTTEAYYRDPQDISKFCPNCGAKMFMRMTHTCPHNIPNLIPTIEELLKGGEE
jgi:DNA-directed RNA polymerase subunit RPC12/RpoP